MGIYTNIQETYSDHFNIMELCLETVSECEAARFEFDRELALEELYAIEQTGSTDILYEDSKVKSVWEKIKAFFKKIIEKVKSFFKKLWQRITCVINGDRIFYTKYYNKFVEAFGDLPESWTYEMYKYTNIVLFSDRARVDKEKLRKIFMDNLSDSDPHDFRVKTRYTSNKGEKTLQLATKKESDETVLRKILKSFNDDNVRFGYISNEKSGMLFRFFRNDQTEKSKVSKKDIYSISTKYSMGVSLGSKHVGSNSISPNQDVLEFVKFFNNSKMAISDMSDYTCEIFEEMLKVVDEFINNKNEKVEGIDTESMVKTAVDFKDVCTQHLNLLLEFFSAMGTALIECYNTLKKMIVDVISEYKGEKKKESESKNESYSYNNLLDSIQFI